MVSDCLFCKIAAGEIPANVAYRDGGVIAVEDVNPQAPTHLLVMPLEHYRNVNELVDAGDPTLLAELFGVAANLGCERTGESGYRIVVNTGPNGGQTVGHLHIHVLAGRSMTWPPG
jgi:histidine triad (HIT) family protein